MQCLLGETRELTRINRPGPGKSQVQAMFLTPLGLARGTALTSERTGKINDQKPRLTGSEYATPSTMVHVSLLVHHQVAKVLVASLLTSATFMSSRNPPSVWENIPELVTNSSAIKL